jgi:integrase
VTELAEAHAARHAPDSTRIAGLVVAYRGSVDWLERVGAGTKKTWAPHLDSIAEHFGPLRVAQFDKPEIRPEIRVWRDLSAATPRKADTGIQVLSALLSFGVDTGRLRWNACSGMDKLYEVDRSEIIWEDEDLAKLEAVASPAVWRMARLGCLTGLRQDDLRHLTWTEVGELAIEVLTRKSRRAGRRTKRRIALVPIYDELRTFLDSIPRTSCRCSWETVAVLGAPA